MGSSGKRRTTMAKLNRESKLREKRAEKQARKAARKLTTASDGGQAAFPSDELDAEPAGLDPGEPERAELDAEPAGLDAGEPERAEPVSVTAAPRKGER